MGLKTEKMKYCYFGLFSLSVYGLQTIEFLPLIMTRAGDTGTFCGKFVVGPKVVSKIIPPNLTLTATLLYYRVKQESCAIAKMTAQCALYK